MRPPRRGAGHRVFVDTSAYVALVHPRDGFHASARVIVARMTAEGRRPFTTNFVVAETHALVLARTGRAVAARLLQELDRSPDTTIVRVGVEDETRAREILTQNDDKDFSLTDALSFAVTERLQIGHAFTFDRHFAQYGFAVLGPDPLA